MRYHHYISAFHLAEFTVDRHRDAQIHVLSLESREQFRVPVNRAGGKRGYNAVLEVPGLDPDSIEQLLGLIESAAAPILHEVNDKRKLPRGAAIRALLDYVALLSVNNPARRNAMNDSQERALYYMAQMMVANPATFKTAQADCRRDGVPLLGNVSYDELREMIKGGSLAYTMPTFAHVRGMGNLVDQLAALLQQRTWSLLIAPPGVPDFVCGDHPVVLTWTVHERCNQHAVGRGQPVFPPGFAMADTELIVPWAVAWGCWAYTVGSLVDSWPARKLWQRRTAAC